MQCIKEITLLKISICLWKCRSVGCSVMSDSLWPHGLKPIRLLHPWESPGKNTGVGSLFLLQGIFPTQGSNPGLLRCRQIGKSICLYTEYFYCPKNPLCSIYSSLPIQTPRNHWSFYCLLFCVIGPSIAKGKQFWWRVAQNWVIRAYSVLSKCISLIK